MGVPSTQRPGSLKPSPEQPAPRWRAWCELTRLANLPTVVSNLFTGGLLAVAWWTPSSQDPLMAVAPRLWLAVACVYAAGMVFNDVFDAAWDARHRPDRPIPSGRVAKADGLVAGVGLNAAGFLLGLGLPTNAAIQTASFNRPPITTWMPEAGILAMIALAMVYNALHKQTGIYRLVTAGLMGSIRGLVVLAGASVVAWRIQEMPVSVWVYAGILTLYTAGLTAFAQSEHIKPNRKAMVPNLIAGMCLLDAVAIATTDWPYLAWIPLLLGALTVGLQQRLPAT